jgi:UDP-N-acetylglucosamine 4,6-dehydratase/5-epimerase
MLNDKNVLITGGTGSFGQRMTRTILERYKPKKLIVFSRDELKQYKMAEKYSPAEYDCIRYFIGDVRDWKRLHEAFRGVDYVIHAAALKQVPTAEYNPFEAIKTNVLGAQNVIQAAIEMGVKKVIALSTDKAANPINLYGATKLCSDKLFIAGNSMAGLEGTDFAVVRYGNVVGSRGSVVPLFLRKAKEGNIIPITDPRMTRFSLNLQHGVDFVLSCLETMEGGEIFVPKLPSFKVVDLVKAVAPEAEIKVIGIRPGEKLHEKMVPEDESWHTLEFKDHYVIMPSFEWWNSEEFAARHGGKFCPDGFCYSSGNNDWWLDIPALKKIIEDFQAEGYVE